MNGLVSVSYEEARREYFEEQMKKAERRMKYWSARASRFPTPLTRAYEMASEMGQRVGFYADALDALDKIQLVTEELKNVKDELSRLRREVSWDRFPEAMGR